MTEIAQAYFHFQPLVVERADLARYGRVAEEIARIVGERRLPFHTELTVVLERGSLRGWITAAIFSGLFAAYHGIADYKGFKEGLGEMVSDAQSFSGAFNKKFISDNVAFESVFRTERRTKTPGKILRALNVLEHINSNRENVTQEELKNQISYVTRLLADAEVYLNTEDSMLLNSIVRKEKYPEAPYELLPRSVIRPDLVASLSLFERPETDNKFVRQFRLHHRREIR
jgi:hypothetical protein